MAKRDVVLTYDDYAALPADGRRYEIHDGELSVTAAPSPQHQNEKRGACSARVYHIPLRSVRRGVMAALKIQGGAGG